MCYWRVSVLVLLLTGGEVQELAHKASLSSGRWKKKVPLAMRDAGRGFLWLGHDQWEGCRAGLCLGNKP